MKVNKDNIKGFPKKHPILFHLLLIVITFFVVTYGVLLAVDSFTRHGEYEVVPNIEGLSLQDASEKLDEKGLKWEVTDSSYSDTCKPGAVLDQEPKAGSKVKPQRVIYLTMNAVSPRMVTVPKITDMSYRQGMAILEGLGFKNVRVETVFSPYKELILGVKANGNSIDAGARLPLSATIEVSVGNGLEEALPDSIETDFALDSLMME